MCVPQPGCIDRRRSLGALASVLDRDPAVGAVAPRIEQADGTLASSHAASRGSADVRPGAVPPPARSRGRTGRTTSSATPRVRPAGSPEWVSGACCSFDARCSSGSVAGTRSFFLYGEDIDLCKRIRELGYDIRFEPGAIVVHSEGASAPRAATLPLLAASRLLYARKHASRRTAVLERVGVGIEELTRAALSRGGLEVRRGHVRALARVVSGGPGPTTERVPSARTDE